MGGSQSNESAPFNYDSQLFEDAVPQSIEVPGQEERKGEGKVRRHPKSLEKLVTVFNEEEDGGYKTVWEMFERGVKKFPESRALGTRKFVADEKTGEIARNTDKTPKRAEYVWNSYKDFGAETIAVGAGLVGLGAKVNDSIGIFSSNRAEWLTSCLGIYSQSLVTVALYATLGDDAVEYIINHSETKIIFVAKENLPSLITILSKIKITHIVQFDVDPRFNNVHETVDEASKKQVSEFGVELIGFSELKRSGEAKGLFPNPPAPESTAYLMYTSGTTGNPKGALLNHSTIVSAAAAAQEFIPMTHNDIHISYLPLAHIFEAAAEICAVSSGVAIGYFQNNIKRMTDDMLQLKPTFFCGVPRVFSRMRQVAFASVAEASAVKKWVFNKCYNGQIDNIRAGVSRSSLYDKVLFAARARTGLDSCRVIVSGAAPLPPDVCEFLKAIVGCPVIQGYGMTETAAALTATYPIDRRLGHCGPPTRANEVKLVDIPEMGYTSEDKPHPRGEVWTRGCVFSGYYKDPENTASTINSEGWLATGDVGRWNPNGTLSIIDRKKNMFKLSQGEYIAVEKVESVYGQAPAVGQLWVYGNSFKSFLIAVVVPNADFVSKHAQAQGWWPSGEAAHRLGSEEFIAEFEKLINGDHSEAIKAAVTASLKEQEKSLKGFERVSDFILEGRVDKLGLGFTEANNCMTPTFKLRRPFLLARYITQLKASYAKLGEPVGPDEKWPGEP